MNYALIFAGGTGQRMNSRAKPKQFLELHGKPILIYTLEWFDKHPMIDGIYIVCLSGWRSELEDALQQYRIKKVKLIVTGGNTGHESIFNGLRAMKEACAPEDIVLIHDGVRPLISAELISENISCVEKYGNAITVEGAAESVVKRNEGGKILEVPMRDLMGIAKAPQSFRYKDILEVHEQAEKDRFLSIDSCHLMNHYGRTLYEVKSTPYNIKIATPSDFYVFRALYEAQENSQIFGY